MAASNHQDCLMDSNPHNRAPTEWMVKVLREHQSFPAEFIAAVADRLEELEGKRKS